MNFLFVTHVWFPMFLNVCLQSSVLLILAILGIHLTKNRSAARRHPIAALALAALLLLPFLMWILPWGWQLPGSAPLEQTGMRTIKNVSPGSAIPSGAKLYRAEIRSLQQGSLQESG